MVPDKQLPRAYQIAIDDNKLRPVVRHEYEASWMENVLNSVEGCPFKSDRLNSRSSRRLGCTIRSHQPKVGCSNSV